MSSGIYYIKNKIHGKLYIGSAVCVSRRWITHRDEFRRNVNSQHLQRAWNKYGAIAFEFRVIEEVSDKLKLIEREQFWMDYHKSWDPRFGYNICRRAGSSLGLKFTAESRKKLRLAWRHRAPMSIVTRRKMSESKIGHHFDIDTIQKIRQKAIGNVRPLGYHHTEKTKRLLRDKAKLRYVK